jgi:hypothetical protein
MKRPLLEARAVARFGGHTDACRRYRGDSTGGVRGRLGMPTSRGPHWVDSKLDYFALNKRCQAESGQSQTPANAKFPDE